MGGIYAVLEKIKDKPGMYIGKSSITILSHFLTGYEFARSELGLELTEEEVDFYEHFHAWIERYFNLRTSNSWANIILLFTGDESRAFDCFFKLLDEFKKRDQSFDDRGENVIKSYFVQDGKIVGEIGKEERLHSAQEV
ncbi:hypothetical protein NIES2107_11680 [Nostoc carneum NIES-2107]|nr:hypothetical protein NIES2107_11680 [Nostoc carneum NIES-2107]